MQFTDHQVRVYTRVAWIGGILFGAGVMTTHEIELWPKEVQGIRHSGQVLRETVDTVLARVGAAG